METAQPHRSHDGATDAELITKSRGGDITAFETLVGRHKRSVVGLVLGIVGDASTAREVAHDAFCAVYYSLARLRESAQFATWVATIARNFALADRRERARRDRHFRPLDAATAAAAASRDRETPAEATDRSEVAATVAATVSRLPESLRAVVTARYFDGLSCEEIATRHGTSVGTVTKRLTRARRMLKERLNGLFGERGTR